MKTSAKPTKKRKVSVFITQDLYKLLRKALGPRDLSPWIARQAERGSKKLAA
jgi:hypothetical protein